MINNPADISLADIELLKKLKEDYPYFSTIDMLLTKAYHQHESIQYHQQLKETSISIVDREALYNLIYRAKVTEVKEEIEKEIESVDQAQKEEEKSKNQELVKDEIEEGVGSQEELKEDKLETLILSSAVSSYDLLSSTQSEQKEEPEVDKKEDAKKNELDNVEEVSVADAHISNVQEASFYGWLNPSKSIEDSIESSTPKKSIDDLVEEFLQDRGNEKIKNRREFFSPINIAKVGIVEKDSFATETLASIYFKQKKYEKAIDTYEKLILKIPEKKPYFVDRIKKIKRLLNN